MNDYHSTFDRMPVSHALMVKNLTTDEWGQLGGWRDEFPRILKEANRILESISSKQDKLLKRAITDLSIDMNKLQCEIRDQA